MAALVKLQSIVLLALASACSKPAPAPKTPLVADTVRPVSPEPWAAAIDTSMTADTAIGDCTVALHPPRERERAVIDALRFAYGLEQALYQHADSVTSWDQVYSHYRRGFSEQLARQLADYSWSAESGTVRATDAAMVVPDSVGVLKLERNEALVAWISRDDFRQRWELPRCIVDRLERHDNHWVVVERRP